MTDVDHRKLLTDLKIHSESEFDSALLTVSGGALGLSIGFARDLIGPDPVHESLVLWAWGAWALTLILIIGSHFLSALAMQAAIDSLDAKRKEGDDGGRPGRILPLLNGAAGIAFVAGMAFFAIFVHLNWR
jgi:hypothetical protein